MLLLIPYDTATLSEIQGGGVLTRTHEECMEFPNSDRGAPKCSMEILCRIKEVSFGSMVHHDICRK